MRSSYSNASNLFSKNAKNYNGTGTSYGSVLSHGTSIFSSSLPAHGTNGSTNIFGDNYTNIFGNNSVDIFGSNPNDLQVFQMFPSEAELSKLKEQ